MAPKLSSRQQAWLDLELFLNKWFYKPDLMALRAALACGRAHYYLQSEPVWMMVIGPPGGGKTRIIIHAVKCYPHTHYLGDLTVNTFLTGKRGRKSFLLEHCKPHGIMLFKDFTTFLSKRAEDRAAIGGQLREIYDGRFVKSTGDSGTISWEGKVTTIGAGTYAFDRAWAFNRELGERFVTIRLEAEASEAVCDYAVLQAGHENEISATISSIVTRFLGTPPETRPSPLPQEIQHHINAIATLAALSRAHVVHAETSQTILDVQPAELPTRLSKQISLLVAAHADMFERSANEEDVTLADRIAFDSIPRARLKVLQAIPSCGCVNITEIVPRVKLPRTSIIYVLNELVAMGICEDDTEGCGGNDAKSAERVLEFTSNFCKLYKRCLEPTRSIAQTGERSMDHF